MINSTQKAINELLKVDFPEEYSKTIKIFTEAWMCSNFSDGTTSDERSRHIEHVKAINRFLKKLKKADKAA